MLEVKEDGLRTGSQVREDCPSEAHSSLTGDGADGRKWTKLDVEEDGVRSGNQVRVESGSKS